MKDSDDVERLALQIWREREMGFPAFVRRLTPDAMDHATGAWQMVLRQAEAAQR